MRHLDTILGSLRSAGFSIEDAAHALWLLDSYVYGQVIQETSLTPVGTFEWTQGSTAPSVVSMSDYPRVVELGEHIARSRYSVDREFRDGLELILDALERTAPPPAGARDEDEAHRSG